MTSYINFFWSLSYYNPIGSTNIGGLLISDPFIIQNQIFFSVYFRDKNLNVVLIQKVLCGIHDDFFEICNIHKI